MSDLPPSYAALAARKPTTATPTLFAAAATNLSKKIAVPATTTTGPSVTINGQVYPIPADVGPLTSLAQFIRSNTKYTGTKISCNEGMCGACTVMITYTDPSTGNTESHGVNGCLRPVLACNGMSVTTNDGLVTKDPSTFSYKFHEIQSRLANYNGSQCGYCSNGMVMNMYDFLQNNPNPTELDIERAFDGNLCRCTGYRPILDAMHTFAPTSTKLGGGHDDCSEDDCRKKGCQRRQKVFPDLEDITKFIHKPEKEYKHDHNAIKAVPLPKSAPIVSVDPYNNQWNEITSITQLNSILKASGTNNNNLIVNAATSFGVFTSDRSMTNTNYLYIGNIPEMRAISHDDSAIYIGGAVTIDAVITYMNSCKTSQAYLTKHLPQVVNHLKRIAGRQVRNAGSLAGNIMVAQKHQEPNDFFPSDGSVVLMGLGASIGVYDAIKDQLLAWDMTTFFANANNMVGKYISKITIPMASSPKEVFMSYKVAMRQQGAHAEVNAAMKATPNGTTLGPNVIVAIGGIAPTITRYTQVEQQLANATNFTDPTFIKQVCTVLQQSLSPAPMNGRLAFRKATAVNDLFKFLCLLNPNLPANYASATEPWPTRPVSGGTQSFTPDPTKYPVSQAMIKIEAPFQTSGMAKYTNDLPAPERTLQARIVTSTQGNCTLASIDTSAAEQLPGFVRFVGAADMLPNTNEWTNGDLIASIGGPVSYAGQVIGVVLASDDVTAWLAAYAISATYTNVQPPITTLEQAVTANSTSSNIPPPVVRGNAATAYASSALQVSGTLQIGPQNHFFLENHTATCIPRDGEYEVAASTQMPVGCQTLCAQVAGVPTSKITVTTKLVGGGFGGKISHSTQVAALATLCSAITGTAVSLLISLDQCSQTFGTRDVKQIQYQAGLNKDGTFNSLSCNVLNSCGAANTDEFGDAIVMLHSLDNCYNIPNVNFTAVMLITNYAPAAACRGPGWVHAVHGMEAIISDISSKTNIDATALREANFYQKGDSTPDGMILQYWTLGSVWSQLKASADYDGKVAAIAAFNQANRWRKRGLSMVPTRFGISLAGANFDSLIAIYPDGTVTVNHGGNEIGQGINTRLAQVVAYKFGISADNINVVSVKPTCTNIISAPSNVTGGSVTAEMNAASLLHAADTLLRRLMPFQKPGQSWTDLIAAASAAGVPLTSTGWTNAPPTGLNSPMFNYNVCAASLTVAEVDMLSGQTEIISTDLVYDCGLSTSPLLDIGQIEGGFIFGVGMLMTEELAWDAVTGEPTARTHWNYKIPCSFTIPEEFNIALLKDAPNPLGVLGSKGSGEPGVCMAASVPQAVESAITAARAANGLGSTRWTCQTYPLTVDKAQQACGTTVANYF